MNTDPQQIRADVEAVLAGLPGGRAGTPGEGSGDHQGQGEQDWDIDAVGRRLEQAHQILVDALESVERG
jgi:hypothetical protein